MGMANMAIVVLAIPDSINFRPVIESVAAKATWKIEGCSFHKT